MTKVRSFFRVLFGTKAGTAGVAGGSLAAILSAVAVFVPEVVTYAQTIEGPLQAVVPAVVGLLTAFGVGLPTWFKVDVILGAARELFENLDNQA